MRLLTAVLLSMLVAGSAQAQDFAPVEGLAWQWGGDGVRSWYVEAEVHLPGFMWFAAEHNKEARVVAYQVRMIMSCPQAAAVEEKNGWELQCSIDEIGLKAATVSPDRPMLPDILLELDRKLTGAPLVVTLRKDGRIRSLELDAMEKENLRTGRIHENTRQVLYRAVAGFDLQLPRKGYARYPSWAQNDSVLMWSPSAVGTLASTEFVHQLVEMRGPLAIIQTQGRGIVVPGAGDNQFQTNVDAMAVFDVEKGELVERVWNALGKPTASSPMAEGTRGFEYRQQGKITAITGAIPSVGSTGMVDFPGAQVEGTLPMWQPLGLIPQPVPPPPGVR